MYLKPCIFIIFSHPVKMWKFLLFLACVCISIVTSWRGFLLGTGRWLVLNVEPCDNQEQYEVAFNVSRKKINRTHDCFDIYVDLKKVVDSTLDVKIMIYQLVDGGFKYFQTMADDSACEYLMRHAKENVIRALTMAKIDPPDCPIMPKQISLTNFVMDYRQLPKHGVYGTYEAVVSFAKFACLKVTVSFEDRNEDESDER